MVSYRHRYMQALNGATLVAVAFAAALILHSLIFTATSAETGNESADWEVWALDQGSDINRIHVYQQEGDEFVEVERITFAELDEPHSSVQTPHMISFDESNRYAAIASTASGTVSIVRTSDYEVIETIETGATAHMATFAPAPDNSIWVANIGAQTFTQIEADLENEQFGIGQDIPLVADLQAGDWPGWSQTYGDDIEEWPGPVCHDFTSDGQFAYVTLGPAAGGLVVVDVETGEIAQAFDPREVRANCGLALSDDHNQMYANWGGALGDLDDPQDAEPGEWYVFDTGNHELVETQSSLGEQTHGQDPHGTRVTPDGSEMWQVNRISNDGIVVDTATQEIIDEYQLSGTPDIISFSPDGDYLFVTLRGPNPASMPHVAEGQTPGVEVFDTTTRQSVAVLQPYSEDEAVASDFHGVAVRGPVDEAGTDDAEPVADDDAEVDDTEDLIPATGGVHTSTGFLAAILAALGAALGGAATIIRRRTTPSRST